MLFQCFSTKRPGILYVLSSASFLLISMQILESRVSFLQLDGAALEIDRYLRV